MKLFKSVAALMPTVAVAASAAAEVSTTTVMDPVTTRTHTHIVFVTVTAGPTVSTCLASLCGSSNASVSELSTIRMTSFTTATTTKVITPPNITTTIDHATDKSISTSCVMRPPSTITVTVTETSIPVITKSVYPIPASSETNEPAMHTPPYPSKSCSSGSASVLPSPPYMNGSNINTMASQINGTTGYSPLHTGVLGALPDNTVSISAMETSATQSLNKVLGPFENTEGVFGTSSTGRLRPLRLFAILTRLIFFVNFAKSEVIGAASHHIESRFYPYPAPLNSGPPPHLTNTPRNLALNTTTESQILGTRTTTSTITLTVTDEDLSKSLSSSPSPSIVAASSMLEPLSLVSPPLLQEPDVSSPDPSVFATVTPDSALPIVTSSSTNSVGPMSSEISSAKSESYTLWSSSAHNITVLVTVTEPASSTMIATTMTMTATSNVNVTNTIEKQTTHTTTVSKTTDLFTEGAAPTAAGIVDEFDLVLSYVIIATWIVLFAMA